MKGKVNNKKPTSLRDKSLVAFKWDLIGNYGGQVVTFFISVALARILSPAEFGLVGISMVLINILKIALDMGLATALVQNENNTSITYSSVFYMNVVFGIVFSLIIYFSAPLAGKFYDNQVITQIVELLAISYFISSLYIVQSTILKIELNFKSLTIRDLTAQLGAGIIAIIFALNGFGVTALVIQLIVSELLKLILILKVASWYPKLEFSWLELKKLYGFSMYVLFARFLGQVTKEMDTLAVGKLFSPAILGFYSRANSFNNLISKNASKSLTNVFYPVLSKVKNDEEKFELIYLKLIEIIAVISFFLTGIFFLSGEYLIIGLFGEKWMPSVTIFKVLVLVGFVKPISEMNVNAFLAKGKAKENFHLGNVRKIMRLFPIVIAFFYGFNSFLYAIVLITLLIWLINIIVTAYYLKIRFWKQFKPVFIASILVTVSIFTSYLGGVYFIGTYQFLSQLIIYITVFILLLIPSGSVLIVEGRVFLNLLWNRLNKS